MYIKLDVNNKELDRINFLAKKKWHYGIEKTVRDFKQGGQTNLQISFSNDKKLHQVAYLKSAYLLAFSKVGYSLIFDLSKNRINQSYQLIREQISNPIENIVPQIIVSNSNSLSNFIGVSIIYEPKEIRSLLVVYKLTLNGNSYTISTVLPGPDSYGFKALEKMKDYQEKDIEMSLQLIPKLDITTSTGWSYYYNTWKRLNGWAK